MLLPHRTIARALAVLCVPAFAIAEPAALTKEQTAAAVRTDDFSIPTPGEFMAALNKIGKLDWKSKYRPPISTAFASRAQMALNLGTLIADGYLAVEAQDAQTVRNVGRDIMALAKPLGVREEIINRGKSMTDFAEDGRWDQLKEELEATQNEVKTALADKADSDLIALVSVGGWARGTEVISSHVAEKYSPEAAKLLRQPGIVAFLAEKLDALPEKMRDDPSVKRARIKMNELQTAVSFSRETTPTQAEVKNINSIASELVKDVAKKDLK